MPTVIIAIAVVAKVGGAFTGARNDLNKVKVSLSQINRSVSRVKATS